MGGTRLEASIQSGFARDTSLFRFPLDIEAMELGGLEPPTSWAIHGQGVDRGGHRSPTWLWERSRPSPARPVGHRWTAQLAKNLPRADDTPVRDRASHTLACVAYLPSRYGPKALAA